MVETNLFALTESVAFLVSATAVKGPTKLAVQLTLVGLA